MREAPSGGVREHTMAKLSKGRSRKKRITGADAVTSVMEYVVTILCMAMVVVIPLYMENKFFGIGQCKYDTYMYLSAFGLGSLVVLGIAFFVCKGKELCVQWFKERLNTLDIAVLLYFVCVLISYLLSDYKKEAWMGYSGWNMGLYSQITFVLLYFFVSRFCKDYKIVLVTLCITSAIVFLLGVLNRFLIDPLGVYKGIDESYQLLFLSTLGQSSWYSSFVCTVMPAGVYFFWKSDNRVVRIFSGVYTFLAFATLVTQNSDSAYVAFGAFMLFFLWFSFDSLKGLKRFVELLFVFAAASKSMWLMTLVGNASVINQLDKISQYFIYGNLTWIMLIICTIAIIGMLLIKDKVNYSVKVMHIVRNILFAAAGLLVGICVIIIILSAHMELPEFLRSVPYLVWNDHWGNNRGFSWRVTWQMFTEMDSKNMLIGVGPECYPYYAYAKYKDVLDTMWGGKVLSNAHNEWYNAMINYGMIGAFSYLAIFITGIAQSVKEAKKNAMFILVGACVVAYVGHNFFCYQQVLCTPFVLIVLAIGRYLQREV